MRSKRKMPRSWRLERLESRYLCASDWQNPMLPYDVDGSGSVEPRDALIVITELNRAGSRALGERSESVALRYFDTNGNGRIEPMDVLLIITSLNTLDAGDVAPPVRLSNQAGEAIDLSDFLGQQSVVLYFYPKNFTPGCTAEALDFSARTVEIESLGAKVFGVSLDSVQSHSDFSDSHKLKFDILADPEHAVTMAYGALKETAGGDPIAKRMTFIIGRDGLIKKVYSDVNVAVHGAQVVEDLRAGIAS